MLCVQYDIWSVINYTKGAIRPPGPSNVHER